jgi:hypothetical protein
MPVASDDALAVNANDDELPGILTDTGTVRLAELLEIAAPRPESGAAGDSVPVQRVFSPGINFGGEHVSAVIEYVTVPSIESCCVSLTVPALAVIAADCTGVLVVVVALNVTLLEVHPIVIVAGTLMPVPVVVIAIGNPAVPAGADIAAVQAVAEPAPIDVGAHVKLVKVCPVGTGTGVRLQPAPAPTRSTPRMSKRLLGVLPNSTAATLPPSRRPVKGDVPQTKYR